MQIVYRYKMAPATTPILIEMPTGAVILSVGIKENDNAVSLWALCPADSPEPRVNRWFYCVGTGWELPDDKHELDPLKFIGTVLHRRSNTVYHVFETRAP